MDTTLLRLIAQIALVLWCATEIFVLLQSRGHVTPVVGVRFAILGLVCFAGWMFLSALSIRDIALFPRSQLVVAISILEIGTAGGAWGWMVVSVHKTFRFPNFRHPSQTSL